MMSDPNRMQDPTTQYPKAGPEYKQEQAPPGLETKMDRSRMTAPAATRAPDGSLAARPS